MRSSSAISGSSISLMLVSKDAGVLLAASGMVNCPFPGLVGQRGGSTRGAVVPPSTS